MGRSDRRFRAGVCSALVLAGLLAHSAWAGPPLLTPDRRGAAAPDRAFDLTALNLDLKLDPAARAVSGTATFTVNRLSPGPLVLDQVALTIIGVTVAGGEQSFYTQGNTLVIPLPEVAGPQVVQVSYSATPDNGLHFRDAGPNRSPEIWSQGEAEDHRHWFPSWDHPNDRFRYTGRFQAPEGWSVLTNSGEELVNYLIMVAAGPYRRYGDPDNEVWAPASVTAAQAERIRAPIPSMKALFKELTGAPYPWTTYRQVLVQGFLWTGMENTSATTLDQLVATPDRSWDTRSARHLNVIAHELAHQWFGDLVTCRTFRELWLNEGFATFLALEWTATVEGPAYRAWLTRSYFRSSEHPVVMAARFHQGEGVADSGQVYVKGASVLQMLKVMVGEETFWRGVQLYVARSANSLVETSDLRRAMETVSGQELDWFFQQWVELPYVPELNVSYRHLDGQLTVSVTQRIDDTQPRFTLPIHVVAVRGEERISRRAWLEHGRLDLDLPLSGPADYVAFDPEGGLLSRLQRTQDPVAWEAQLRDPSPFARLEAIEALGKTARTDALAALLRNPEEDRWIRVAAAAALGEQRSGGALQAGLADPDGRVRLAAAEALGRVGEPALAPDLVRAFKADPNPDVAAALLAALANLDPARALGLARSALRDGETDTTRLVAEAARVVGQHGDIEDLPKLLRVRGVHREVVDGHRGAVMLVGRQPETPAKLGYQTTVRRSLETLLLDQDRRIREAAIDLLGALGDPAAVPALERLRREDLAVETPAHVDRAIAAISQKKPAGAAPGDSTTAAAVEQLERRLQELDQRLLQLETRH